MSPRYELPPLDPATPGEPYEGEVTFIDPATGQILMQDERGIMHPITTGAARDERPEDSP